MSKDPAFLFYPNDYIGGTMGMTLEEKGAYIEILMMQFNRGHMTSHMIGQVIGQLWGQIQHKFKKDSDGLWYNVRLEEEQIRRKDFVISRRNNKLGTNQHTKKDNDKSAHMTSHMEDVNENVIVNKVKDIIKHKHGDDVFLSDKEFTMLVDKTDFEIAKKCIEKLDNYKGATGKKYKSDYKAILNWVIDEVKKGSNNGSNKKQTPRGSFDVDKYAAEREASKPKGHTELVPDTIPKRIQ